MSGMSVVEYSYESARELGCFSTGDVVAIGGNPFTSFFQRIGRGQWGGNDYYMYTHIGVVVVSEGRRWLYSMDGRYNVPQPLSQFIDKPMALFKTSKVYSDGMLPNGVILPRVVTTSDAAKQIIFNHSEKMIKYDTPSFATIGVRILTGLRLPVSSRKIVCSEITRLILLLLGWIFPDDFPSNPSVNEMCNAIRCVHFANIVPNRGSHA